MKIELLHIRDCPHVEQTKQLLADCLDEIGLGAIQIDDLEGEFSSPSIMVDGSDVMGEPAVAGACCRHESACSPHFVARRRWHRSGRSGNSHMESQLGIRFWPAFPDCSSPHSLRGGLTDRERG